MAQALKEVQVFAVLQWYVFCSFQQSCVTLTPFMVRVSLPSTHWLLTCWHSGNNAPQLF